MKLQYLGTAASEGWPAIFCECPACKRATALGGKNIRLRSGAMVNDRLLIDVPPDLFAAKLRLKLDLSPVRSIVITHSHMDHFNRETLSMFIEPFSHLTARGTLHLYGSEHTGEHWEKYLSARSDNGERIRKEIRFHVVMPYESFLADGITFTALPATHGCPGSLLYILEQGEDKLLYGNDTGLWCEENWAALEKRKAKPFTFVSLDGTMGTLDSSYTGHMSFKQNIAVRQRMLDMGLADQHTVFITTHFSHNGGLPHDELQALMNPQGFQAAYDGFTIGQ